MTGWNNRYIKVIVTSTQPAGLTYLEVESIKSGTLRRGNHFSVKDRAGRPRLYQIDEVPRGISDGQSGTIHFQPPLRAQVREGQYLDFHHALYAVQSPLENSGFWSNETLVNIGKKIGITSKSFEDCVTKGSKIEVVKANYDSMSKFGVQGTPTVFINGKKWERTQNEFSLEEFKAAVEAA